MMANCGCKTQTYHTMIWAGKHAEHLLDVVGGGVDRDPVEFAVEHDWGLADQPFELELLAKVGEDFVKVHTEPIVGSSRSEGLHAEHGCCRCSVRGKVGEV